MNEFDKLKEKFENAKKKYDDFLDDHSRDRSEEDDYIQPLMPAYDEETKETFMAVGEDKVAVLTLEDIKQLQQLTMGIMMAQGELVDYKRKEQENAKNN